MKVYNAYEYFYEFGHGGDAEKHHIGTYATEEAMLKEVMDKVEENAWEIYHCQARYLKTEKERDELAEKVEKFINEGKKGLDWDFNELDEDLQGVVGIEVVEKDIK